MLNEYISREKAEKVYGVVFKDGGREVDKKGTAELRERMKKAGAALV